VHLQTPPHPPTATPTATPPHPTPRKNKEALYKFSRVFPEDSNQGSIFTGVAQPLLADLLSGKQPEAVIMAYGVTSAGKTFTMQVGGWMDGWMDGCINGWMDG